MMVDSVCRSSRGQFQPSMSMKVSLGKQPRQQEDHSKVPWSAKRLRTDPDVEMLSPPDPDDDHTTLSHNSKSQEEVKVPDTEPIVRSTASSPTCGPLSVAKLPTAVELGAVVHGLKASVRSILSAFAAADPSVDTYQCNLCFRYMEEEPRKVFCDHDHRLCTDCAVVPTPCDISDCPQLICPSNTSFCTENNPNMKVCQLCATIGTKYCQAHSVMLNAGAKECWFGNHGKRTSCRLVTPTFVTLDARLCTEDRVLAQGDKLGPAGLDSVYALTDLTFRRAAFHRALNSLLEIAEAMDVPLGACVDCAVVISAGSDYLLLLCRDCRDARWDECAVQGCLKVGIGTDEDTFRYDTKTMCLAMCSSCVRNLSPSIRYCTMHKCVFNKQNGFTVCPSRPCSGEWVHVRLPEARSVRSAKMTRSP